MVKRAHFIGIGGIGISALARWFLAKSAQADRPNDLKGCFRALKRTPRSSFGRSAFRADLAQNWLISGSDLAWSKSLQNIKNEGVRVKIGHKKANLSPKTDLVVYNNAILPSNPELKEARKRGIKTLSYPEALGELTKQHKTITVSGAHGKSTVTALLALILIEAGFDPTVIVGTKLKQFSPKDGGKNFRLGRGKYLLIEADEWKAAFLNYSPALAVITNIDREHLDFYKNFAGVKKTFLKFIARIKSGGVLVLNRESRLIDVERKIKIISKKNKIKVIWYDTRINSSSKVLRKIKNVLKIPGQHNLSNALGAYTLARALGISEKIILRALSKYSGIWRRMEYRGKFKIQKSMPTGRQAKIKILVYDDYAHHPTEIKATLQAFREKYPKNEIICVFQPHQAERLRLLFKDFIGAFNDADKLILLKTYEVAGRDKTNKKFTSQKLAEAISKKKNFPTIRYLANKGKLRSILTRSLLTTNYSLPPIIVMMGAGDIFQLTDKIIKT